MVFCVVSIVKKLILLNSCTNGCDWICHHHSPCFAYASADKVFLLQAWLRKLSVVIENLWGFVNVHLDNAAEWENQTEHEALCKPSKAVLKINFSRLCDEILDLWYSSMHIQEHSRFYNPKRLGDKCGANTGLNTRICYCIH